MPRLSLIFGTLLLVLAAPVCAGPEVPCRDSSDPHCQDFYDSLLKNVGIVGDGNGRITKSEDGCIIKYARGNENQYWCFCKNELCDPPTSEELINAAFAQESPAQESPAPASPAPASPAPASPAPEYPAPKSSVPGPSAPVPISRGQFREL